MNILWITNIPFGKLIKLAGLTGENTSGSWLDSTLGDFAGDNRYNLVIVTVGRVNSIKTLTEGNVTYCLLPGGYPGEYDHRDRKHIKDWEYINNAFKPDLIHIWGTEFTHGYLALKTMPNIPSVLYIQGLLEAVSRYYLAGMSKHELRNNITFRDILKQDWITRTQERFAKRAVIEAEMMAISNHVIVENKWCASHCININRNMKIHQCELSIKRDFYEKQWKIENVRPFTIICNAGGYPIKGLHLLLKAIRLVVQQFPKTTLFIPGEIIKLNPGFIEKIKTNGYTKFIKSLIKNYKLEENIVFLGPLKSEEMAAQMSTVNAFVLASSIENHSSTLIEAMIVGTPCVASYVGGIPEYVRHGENGLLYRFEEYEMLAEHISTLFSDVEYASTLGKKASEEMRNARVSGKLKEKLTTIYEDVIQKK